LKLLSCVNGICQLIVISVGISNSLQPHHQPHHQALNQSSLVFRASVKSLLDNTFQLTLSTLLFKAVFVLFGRFQTFALSASV
jgi:hypothetical protein